jgi:hypothetical protein
MAVVHLGVIGRLSHTSDTTSQPPEAHEGPQRVLLTPKRLLGHSTIRELRDQPQCLLTAYPTGPSLSITSPGVRVKGIQPLGATGSFLSHPVAGLSCSRLPPKRRLGGVERAMRGDGPTHDGP